MSEQAVGLDDMASARLETGNCACAAEMQTLFERSLSIAVQNGWDEREAAFYIAEAADDHILRLHRLRQN